MTIGKKMTLGLLLPLLTLLGVSAASYWGLQKLVSANELVGHTLGVLEDVESLLAHVLSAQSSVRGYLVTGDDGFLENYRSAVEQSPKMLDQLREAITLPAAQRKLEDLVPALADAFSAFQSLVTTRAGQGG